MVSPTQLAEEVIRTTVADAIRPDPLLTVDAWADKHRILSGKAAAEPGPWRTSRTPYLREVMVELSPMSSVERVVFMAGAQLGKTETGNNWLGYIIHAAPGPVLNVMPTVEMAKRNSRQRLDPLIEESPALRERVKDRRSRDSGNTVLMKEFPGGVLIMAGANSAVGLRSMPTRYLFLDECDGYPGDVDEEGDPINLAVARTRTFARRKIYMVSTPKISGVSRIERAFLESDQRYFWVPCPHCKEMQVLRFSQLRWPKGDPDQAIYECEHCREPIQNYQKAWMLPRGEWRPSATGDGKTAGFHLSGLYSPVGWFNWAEAASAWEKAQGHNEALQEFVNTVLAETWQLQGEAPDAQRLYERRESYHPNEPPENALFLTAGVDVQGDRVELEIVGWGRGRTSWSIDYRVIYGDPEKDSFFESYLTPLLDETWTHPSGVEMKLSRIAIDSGHATTAVYMWARNKGSRVMVVKGDARTPGIIGQPTPVEVSHRGRKLKGGVHLWLVNTSLLKEELYRLLNLNVPDFEAGEDYPLGFCHFPVSPAHGMEYFQQLSAEQLVTVVRKGYKRREWQKVRDRNEALDCRVYARAAACAYGLDRWSEERWTQLEQQFETVRRQAIEARDFPNTVPPPPAQERPVDGVRRGRKVRFRVG